MSKKNQFQSVDGEKDSKKYENEAKSKKGKKRNTVHLSFRIIIIAMILALLFLLNWDGLHFGGKLGEFMGESQQEENSGSEKVTAETDSNTESTTDATDNSAADSATQENENIYEVIIREDNIIVFDDGKEVEVDRVGLAERLKLLSTETIVLQDDGALNKVYEEVKELITKALSLNTKLQFIEK